VLVGGTGLYVRAFLRGLDPGPARDVALRRRLAAIAARRGPAFLHRMLERFDPGSAARLPPGDRQRVARALEVRLLTGSPLSSWLAPGGRDLWREEDRMRCVKIGLRRPRAELLGRIEERVEAMFGAGLVDEVKGLLARGVPAQANAFKGIGYREALAVAQGTMDENEARRRTVLATRRYAKRQMTWFRREPGVRWMDAGPDPAEDARRAEEGLA
jgi:tRNA dimethylallyltransferase